MISGLWTRRSFLTTGLAAGGGLLVGLLLPGCRDAKTAARQPEPASFNAFVEIEPMGRINIVAPNPELGQGVRTSLPMIVAEELSADWSDVSVVQASAHSRYGPMAVAGSDSVFDYWEDLRAAGAVAKLMLIAAAAQRWGVDPSECHASMSEVIHSETGRTYAYGELATEAAALPLPAEVRFKTAAEYELMGTRVAPVDGGRVVDGLAVYGIDVRVPGMLYAAVARCPFLSWHAGQLRRCGGAGRARGAARLGSAAAHHRR